MKERLKNEPGYWLLFVSRESDETVRNTLTRNSVQHPNLNNSFYLGTDCSTTSYPLNLFFFKLLRFATHTSTDPPEFRGLLSIPKSLSFFFISYVGTLTNHKDIIKLWERDRKKRWVKATKSWRRRKRTVGERSTEKRSRAIDARMFEKTTEKGRGFPLKDDRAGLGNPRTRATPIPPRGLGEPNASGATQPPHLVDKGSVPPHEGEAHGGGHPTI